MFNLKLYLESRREIVEERLSGLLGNSENLSRLESAMSYSLMAGGKRLRPVLCLAAAEAVGDTEDNGIDAACALEMIHTYSLIHDDLPAMDDDALRRGNPTCHIEYDEATAILAGDALLTMAFEVLSDTRPADPSMMLKIIRIISRASGHKGMIDGQMMDILSEGKVLSREELEKLHHLKTGELIKASVLTGAILGGGSEKEIESLDRYAAHIGLAFQVADDILNVEGDPELMGKAVGTDMDLAKATYPSLMGLEESKRFAGDLIAGALGALTGFDDRSEPLRAIAKYVIERKR